MADDKLKTCRSEGELRAFLQLPQSQGLFAVDEVRILAKVEIHSGQRDVAVYLRGDKGPQQFSQPIFRSQDLVRFAKDVLEIFEPQALDPESQIHQSLHRIEQRLEIRPDD